MSNDTDSDWKNSLERRKLEAEIARAEAETRHFDRQRSLGIAEIIKATGAAVVTIVAVAAAATTYKIVQLETKLADIARTQAYAQRDAALRERDKAVRALSAVAAQKQRAEAQLALLESRATDTRRAAMKARENFNAVGFLKALFDSVAALDITSHVVILSRPCVSEKVERLFVSPISLKSPHPII